jgi:hypothetical protein
MERLAALVPPPRKNQVLYHGVLASRAAWREEIVPQPKRKPRSDHGHTRAIIRAGLASRCTLEVNHTYRLPNAGPSNGRRTSYTSYPTVAQTIEVEGVWTSDALNTDYWFTFTDLTTTACPEDVECEEHTLEGPTLIHDIYGWADSGIQFTALFDTTLDSFVFNNQGSSDTITLYDASSGATLDTIDVAPASGAELVEGEWPLEEGHTYRLTSALHNNGRWVGYTDYPTVGEALEVEGAWGSSGIHPTSWHRFTELSTSVRDD